MFPTGIVKVKVKVTSMFVFQQEFMVIKLKLPAIVHVCGITAPVWGKQMNIIWNFGEIINLTNIERIQFITYVHFAEMGENSRYQYIFFINIIRKWEKIVNECHSSFPLLSSKAWMQILHQQNFGQKVLRCWHWPPYKNSILIFLSWVFF